MNDLIKEVVIYSWIASPFLGIAVATIKGWNKTAGFAAGVFFGPLVILGLLVSSVAGEKTKSNPNGWGK